jgi:hypothetical protein
MSIKQENRNFFFDKKDMSTNIPTTDLICIIDTELKTFVIKGNV